MTSFIEEVREIMLKTQSAEELYPLVSKMAKALIAIDGIVKNSNHGFASELQAEIRKILEGEQNVSEKK